MSRRVVVTQLEGAGGEASDGYFDRVVKYIPSDVVAAYVFASGAIAGSTISRPDVVLWAVFALLVVITPVWTIRMASSAGKPSPRTQAAVSLGALVVWVFALGGPFATLAWYNPLFGSLALVFYTLVSGLVIPPDS